MRARAGVGLVVLGLGGCGDRGRAAPGDTAVLATCDSLDTAERYLVRTLVFGPESDGVAWGFDLDDHVSSVGDLEGCGKQDLVDPDGNTGIDNAFAGLLPTLEQTEAIAVETLIQDAVNSGALLLALELSGVDDRWNDDCVTVRLGRAEGVPLLGNDGLLLDGQTLSWEPDSLGPPIQAALVDGALVASPFTVDIDLRVITADVKLSLLESGLRLQLDEDAPSASGFVSGGFRTAQLLDVLSDQAIDGDLRTILEQGLPLLADLVDPETGACDQMSVTLEYDAVRVFLED